MNNIILNLRKMRVRVLIKGIIKYTLINIFLNQLDLYVYIYHYNMCRSNTYFYGILKKVKNNKLIMINLMDKTWLKISIFCPCLYLYILF